MKRSKTSLNSVQNVIVYVLAFFTTSCNFGSAAQTSELKSSAFNDSQIQNTTPKPVRVSRAFFQDKVRSGSITAVSNDSQPLLEVKSPIEWNEEPTTQPAPEPGALADFRDHTGCAYYQNTQDTAVCFTMMGDVFSLGLNEKETQIRGVEQLVKDALVNQSKSSNCSYNFKNIRFDYAKNESGTVQIYYTAELNPESQQDESCETQNQKVQIQFQLTSNM